MERYERGMWAVLLIEVGGHVYMLEMARGLHCGLAELILSMRQLDFLI